MYVVHACIYAACKERTEDASSEYMHAIDVYLLFLLLVTFCSPSCFLLSRLFSCLPFLVCLYPPLLLFFLPCTLLQRRMRHDGGWIHTMIAEAENERMHLMTFMRLKHPPPSLLFRFNVKIAQVGFTAFFLAAYLLSSRYCHRFVGYLEVCLSFACIYWSVEIVCFLSCFKWFFFVLFSFFTFPAISFFCFRFSFLVFTVPVYIQEEAVKTYTHALHDIDHGGALKHWRTMRMLLSIWMQLEKGG